jgi:hypothetical protein
MNNTQLMNLGGKTLFEMCNKVCEKEKITIFTYVLDFLSNWCLEKGKKLIYIVDQVNSLFSNSSQTKNGNLYFTQFPFKCIFKDFTKNSVLIYSLSANDYDESIQNVEFL